MSPVKKILSKRCLNSHFKERELLCNICEKEILCIDHNVSHLFCYDVKIAEFELTDCWCDLLNIRAFTFHVGIVVLWNLFVFCCFLTNLKMMGQWDLVLNMLRRNYIRTLTLHFTWCQGQWSLNTEPTYFTGQQFLTLFNKCSLK